MCSNKLSAQSYVMLIFKDLFNIKYQYAYMEFTK